MESPALQESSKTVELSDRASLITSDGKKKKKEKKSKEEDKTSPVAPSAPPSADPPKRDPHGKQEAQDDHHEEIIDIFAPPQMTPPPPPVVDDDLWTIVLNKEKGKSIDLTNLLRDDELDKILDAVHSEVFINNQLKLIYHALEDHFLTTAQLVRMIEKMPYFGMKNECLYRAFGKLTDKENFRELLITQVFSDLERKVLLEKLDHGPPVPVAQMQTIKI